MYKCTDARVSQAGLQTFSVRRTHDIEMPRRISPVGHVGQDQSAALQAIGVLPCDGATPLSPGIEVLQLDAQHRR